MRSIFKNQHKKKGVTKAKTFNNIKAEADTDSDGNTVRFNR